MLRPYLRRYLRKAYGVHSVECRHVERLRASLAAGHSIMLAPNHCRMSDPMVLGILGMEADCHLFAMASWHVFKQSRFQTFMIRRMGAFSVFREGNDRQAIDTAIDILVERRRPLIMFPEGAITRHNDLIEEMMEGPSFIARQAAKRLKKQERAGRGRDSSGRHSLRISRRPGGNAASRCSTSWSSDSRGSRKSTCRSSSGSARSARPCWRSRKSSISATPRSGNPLRAGRESGRGGAGQAGSRVEDQGHVGQRDRPRQTDCAPRSCPTWSPAR